MEQSKVKQQKVEKDYSPWDNNLYNHPEQYTHRHIFNNNIDWSKLLVPERIDPYFDPTWRMPPIQQAPRMPGPSTPYPFPETDEEKREHEKRIRRLGPIARPKPRVINASSVNTIQGYTSHR